jgi:hypothetical protein
VLCCCFAALIKPPLLPPPPPPARTRARASGLMSLGHGPSPRGHGYKQALKPPDSWTQLRQHLESMKAPANPCKKGDPVVSLMSSC